MRLKSAISFKYIKFRGATGVNVANSINVIKKYVINGEHI